MKSNLLKLTALLLLFVMMLSACGAPVGTSESTEEDTTEVDTSNDIYIEREDKEVKNILMIGNSFCYYYVEELCGIASADGYELTVANLYKSGAKAYEHLDSLKNDTRIATFYVTNSKQRKEMGRLTTKETLEYAKKKLKGDWDVITLQGSSGSYALIGDMENAMKTSQAPVKELYDYIKENYPNATLYWHQTWSYEIGYGKDRSEEYQMNDAEHRASMYNINKALAYKIAEENDVRLVPSGDAWQIARANELIGTTMCKRLGVNDGEGDYYHDGDIGGGQYLNACVWYEVLMGKSCLGNTWRPPYELSEEKIAILQAAAHEAVAAVYGPGYAK